MQARVRFGFGAGNPLRRSCVSRARNVGESAFWIWRGQPFAAIVRIEGAKCRGDCVLAQSRATLCEDRACQGREMEARVRFGFVRRNPLRRLRVSRARNAGEIAFCICRGQPSAEIVHVKGAKCRRECVLARSGATLCEDRACRGREMQARVRFGPVWRNPLRRSCASRARNVGESAFWPCPAQPSAEIVLVKGAKCRRECALARSGATLCGDRACRAFEMQARVRFGPVRHNPLRRSCALRARNGGKSAFWICPAQPSAEIVRARARNAGEIAFWICRGQPSAEIVRVEGTKRR